MNSERRGISLFGPLLLIALGVLFLLNNMGVIAVDVWEMLFRFWPVLLIAAGLDILLGRRTGVGAVIALLVILILAGGGLWFGGIGNVNAGNLPSETIRQNLEDAEKAVVTISPGVSRLTVGGFLATGQLIQGEIRPLRNEQIERDFKVEGATAYYTLQSKSTGLPFSGFSGRGGQWDLQLNQQTPLDLRISTGVGSAELDLESLTLTALDVDTGVGETTITLPAKGAFEATINGGVGQITVLAPDTLALRIRAEAGLGSVDVEGDYAHTEDLYLSPGYDQAKDKVELTVEGGVGSITIRQIEKR